MSIETDLAKIAEQEKRLRFARLDYEMLWQLGAAIRTLARERGLALAIDIRVAGETIFYNAMPGTSPNNADWARRKRNTVDALHTSSYAVGLAGERDGTTLEQKSGRPQRDFATHGGSFPLMVDGLGAIGTVTVSGAPQRIDHAIVVEALAAMIGVPLAEVALD
ncbi:heme-degrading domain-containing protein [Janthinobacterium agaricidamnosum]|uniref:UPF0303 protein GJA_3051 n=1 Tax=Janthinobacterium agaricidamnosum NBRC 102515 = DSM 9628 TaxID=1349767 RepID=W0V8S5_9BURK|nr:heme-degrading domain-containing protein [Janthinobacterium agaricidamnosum]CDG83677.1 conserved hypothetical protein [Janthinobacterium agaricidamnosum NBRC 102515 = DSM 9628]